MRTLRIIASVLLLAFAMSLGLYTSIKLYKMMAIRGWLPGATFKEHVLTDKRMLEGEFGPSYWIAWDGSNITRPSNSRENLDKLRWANMKIGDKVTIAYYRGDPSP